MGEYELLTDSLTVAVLKINIENRRPVEVIAV